MVHKTREEKIKISQKKQVIGTPQKPIEDEALYTKKDLKKTIVLTTLILCLEFFVFYATLKGIIIKY